MCLTFLNSIPKITYEQHHSVYSVYGYCNTTHSPQNKALIVVSKSQKVKKSNYFVSKEWLENATQN